MTKGKVTKDIFLRVGQGVMRIPRDKDSATTHPPKEQTPPVAPPDDTPEKHHQAHNQN